MTHTFVANLRELRVHALKDYTMTNRKKFIDYVRNGGPRPICSPQIGAGAGYDAKIAGKKAAVIEDTIRVSEMYDMLPLYNFWVDVGATDARLMWQPSGSRSIDKVTIYESRIATPYGGMTVETSVTEAGDSYRSKDAVIDEKDFEKLHWYLDTVYAGNFEKISKIAYFAEKAIGGRGAIDFQWGMQPYELFSIPNTVNTVMLAMDFEKEFFALMDKCEEISRRVIDALREGGGDFVFLGGPGAEMVSPYIYENFMVPYGRRMTDYAHGKGYLVYSHVCSPIEPFLTKGYFNELGIDLFETLSMPPVGNVKSIEDAFTKLDTKMCTRGNVGMDTLINGTPDEVARQVEHIMSDALKAGRKHVVAASDYLMYEVKEENVRALCDAVRDYKI